MKRNIISYISVAAVCCTASVACSDFLTEELQTDYSSKTFYTSAANAERAVNGIYNNIMFTSDQNMLWHNSSSAAFNITTPPLPVRLCGHGKSLYQKRRRSASPLLV